MNHFKIIVISVFFIFFTVTSNSLSILIKAKIGNEIITNIDIDNEIKYLFFLNPKLKDLDISRTEEIAKNSLITEIIKKKELEKFYDFKKTKELINIVEKNLLKKKNIENKNELIEILEREALDYKKIKNKLHVEALWNQLIYKKYVDKIVIDKNNLRNKIQEQFDRKNNKFEYNLSEIVFDGISPENLDAYVKKIKKSINEIGFENSANIYSISNTSKNGGLIGWINELQISSKINNNISTLRIDQISNPIKIDNRYLLIKLNNKREFKEKVNLDDQLKKFINNEKNKQLNNFSIIYFKRLKKNIEINEY